MKDTKTVAFGKRRKSNPFALIFCVLVNFILFGICYYLHLPIRLEHVGSLYAVLSVGTGAGLVVAVVSQLIYSLFYFSFWGMLLLIPVLLILLFAATAKKYGWLGTLISDLGAMTVACVISAVLTILISFLIGRRFMVNTPFWDMYNTLARHLMLSKFKDSFYIVGGYACFNTAATWLLGTLAFALTPKNTGFGLRGR